ncbi:MAG: AAA domain-containing protein, partial [Bacteroidota bacterium]
GGNKQTICAPIFFYPAQIKQDKAHYYLSIKRELAFANTTFLEAYRKESFEIIEILGNFVQEPISFQSCGNLKRTLETSFTQFKSDSILLYPEFMSEKDVKKVISNSSYQLSILPGAVLGVLKHSVNTIGVISEFNKLIEGGEYSTPLKQFFNYDTRNERVDMETNTFVPAILSDPQEGIIQSVDNNIETLVIGPPGTGKSFSIAALAIDQMNKGKSVLVVSKSDEAVDVVTNKIQEDIGIPQITVRAGKRGHLKNLKDRLKDVLSGVPIDYRSAGKRAEKLRSKIYFDRKQLAEWADKLDSQIQDDLKWGTYLFENKDGGIISSIVKKFIEWQNSRQESHFELIDSYYNTKDEYLKDLKQYVELCFQDQLWHTLKHHRFELRNFLQALRARTLAKQEELFKTVNFQTILKAFPIWACKLSDLYEVLPLKKELFDIVIIDEATQCDIAICLPAIQRAKKVVIVGDPKQLRHYSFLARNFTRLLRDKYELSQTLVDQYFDYRDNSILDIYFSKVGDQDQVLFLNEHFRGNDDLIRFSNTHFYQDRLRIIKSLPHHKNEEGIKLISTNGKRSQNGINEKEAKHLLDEVLKVLQRQEQLEHTSSSSIGILSLFRAQAEYLGELITDHIEHQFIAKHKIKIGTPYSFQGDEKDLMFISFGIDSETHSSALRYINTPEVLNVAITRARVNQFVFAFTEKIDPTTLVGKYFDQLLVNENEAASSSQVNDDFHKEVTSFLQNLRIEVHDDYLIAGILIDILILTKSGYYGIDLIGYPGKFYENMSIKEYEILGRSGVKMIPLPYSNWYYENEKTKEDLQKMILQV